MKLINHTFENMQSLESSIAQIDQKNKTVFIQVLCGDFDSNELPNILNLLVTKIPKVSIIGASTAGEIVNGTISRNSILISFSIFDKVEVKTYYFPKSDFENGVAAAKKVVKKDTKACIVLSEALKSDSESFLNGFSSVDNKVIVAGGNAGDNFQFQKTFVIKDEKIYDDGLVIASLGGDSLHVGNDWALDWTPVGKDMTVTKADKNILYEIDNKPIAEVFSYYLGKDVIKDIPVSAIEFPLVKIRDDVIIARSMVAQTEDGGFIFAGHFTVGDKVRFAIGNVEEILGNAPKLQTSVAKKPSEAIYIYSCSVRDMFLKEQLNYEFGLLNDIAPMAGFFTYGEFFHGKEKNKLLNITTTTLCLSESDKLPELHVKKNEELKASMLKSLTHLSNTTQKELDASVSSLNQYKKALDESTIVSKTNKKGIITYVNDKFCDISGYSREELVGSKHDIIKSPNTPKHVFKDMWETITSGKSWNGTYTNLTKNGSEYHVKTVILTIFDDNGEFLEYIAIRTDITDIVKKDEIIKKSLIDTLTGIKNRQALLNYLSKVDKKSVLVLINLDRFSEINDYFGYAVGDIVLTEFSEKLSKILNNDGIYRVSGDEFAIVLESDQYGKKVKEKVLKIVEKLKQNIFKLNSDTISVDATFAMAFGENITLYNLAHVALKEAKLLGKNIVFFNEEGYLKNKIQNNIDIVNRVKTAIKKDRIVPFFQGIVDNKTKQIVKYEALIRLVKEDGSILSPFFFLEHAKKAKIYPQLTQIMIQKTFETFVNLKYDFSINFSISDILSADVREFLCDMLKKYKCGDRLIVEIVESEGIESFDEVFLFVEALRAYGCRIAIDDFGSGYSNFSYLSKINIDFIKIDGSLIKDIDKDENQRIVVESILHFAKAQGIKTIAEFVENKEIFDILVELGVDFSQGFFFSKPEMILCEK